MVWFMCKCVYKREGGGGRGVEGGGGRMTGGGGKSRGERERVLSPRPVYTSEL